MYIYRLCCVSRQPVSTLRFVIACQWLLTVLRLDARRPAHPHTGRLQLHVQRPGRVHTADDEAQGIQTAGG